VRDVQGLALLKHGQKPLRRRGVAFVAGALKLRHDLVLPHNVAFAERDVFLGLRQESL
jgi:hypothetical protein